MGNKETKCRLKPFSDDIFLQKCSHKIERFLNVGFANGSLDSAPLLTRAFIYLKNKQTEVIHENSKNLNQTKLMF
ncbi:hypothetical protein DOL88_02620 [Aggregatibacter aphrophilus]|uniref:Uncharacterized protein n=1 Tax=Aggregatibacter aphrophilus TaxID=732 RepID=A0ABX9VW86_AGGAP|nr:hypothetical protein DOL88_02620 [Aggregatibacter aphrophilus]